MSENTPTEEQARSNYGCRRFDSYERNHGEPTDHRKFVEDVSEFDRFLAAVRAEAWDEGARHVAIAWGMHPPMFLKDNPYRKES